MVVSLAVSERPPPACSSCTYKITEYSVAALEKGYVQSTAQRERTLHLACTPPSLVIDTLKPREETPLTQDVDELMSRMEGWEEISWRHQHEVKTRWKNAIQRVLEMERQIAQEKGIELSKVMTNKEKIHARREAAAIAAAARQARRQYHGNHRIGTKLLAPKPLPSLRQAATAEKKKLLKKNLPVVGPEGPQPEPIVPVNTAAIATAPVSESAAAEPTPTAPRKTLGDYMSSATKALKQAVGLSEPEEIKQPDVGEEVPKEEEVKTPSSPPPFRQRAYESDLPHPDHPHTELDAPVIVRPRPSPHKVIASLPIVVPKAAVIVHPVEGIHSATSVPWVHPTATATSEPPSEEECGKQSMLENLLFRARNELVDYLDAHSGNKNRTRAHALVTEGEILEMAEKQPRDMEELKTILGTRAEKYADWFLPVIQRVRETQVE